MTAWLTRSAASTGQNPTRPKHAARSWSKRSRSSMGSSLRTRLHPFASHTCNATRHAGCSSARANERTNEPTNKINVQNPTVTRHSPTHTLTHSLHRREVKEGRRRADTTRTAEPTSTVTLSLTVTHCHSLSLTVTHSHSQSLTHSADFHFHCEL